jgi:hypothetical protein
VTPPADRPDVRPTPDPTILTTEQLIRAVEAERDYTNGRMDVVLERFRGMDEAVKLLNETVHRVPTDMQQAIGNLSSLMAERFDSVDKQFRERDTRSERESRDNKVAVDAAFAAQKEAAAKQDEANQKAIDKSEKATTETINKLAELVRSQTDALGDKIEDVKARLVAVELNVNGIQQAKVGGQESTTERRMSQGAMMAVAGFGISFVLAVLAVVAFVLARR